MSGESKPEPQTQITSVINRIDKAVGSVAKASQDLENRITTILTPACAAPQGEQVVVNKQKELVLLANTLTDLAIRLETATDFIGSMNRRVEL